MSKTPITVYLDFKTASAIKAQAESQGMSQSQWLGACAEQALTQAASTTLLTPKGIELLAEAAVLWNEMKTDPKAFHDRYNARVDDLLAQRLTDPKPRDLPDVAR